MWLNGDAECVRVGQKLFIWAELYPVTTLPLAQIMD